jgi:SsrA-binding protein
MKVVHTNKKAYFEYEIDATLEAGIALTGDEVKSIREGLVNLAGSFATIVKGELVLLNGYIGAYSHAYLKTRDEDYTRRTRTLLVHRRELDKLAGAVSRKGMTIVPLKVYLNAKGLIKIELGLAKHKNAPQRKEELKERALERETRREKKYTS